MPRNRSIVALSFILAAVLVLQVSFAASLSISMSQGTSDVPYGQSSYANVVISGGTPPYTANVVWCKMLGLDQPCTLPQGTNYANTITYAIPGNEINFTFNTLSYNSIGLTFNGLSSTDVTYNVVTPLSTTANMIVIKGSNAMMANSAYGGWSFNVIVTDNSIGPGNTVGLNGNSMLIFGASPASPELEFYAPGGFIGFISNGNNTISEVNLIPSNIPESNLMALIPANAPGQLLLPQNFFSSTVPSILGVASPATNSVYLINTATRQYMDTIDMGKNPYPSALAFAPNTSTKTNIAIAAYPSNTLTIVLYNPKTGSSIQVASNIVDPAHGTVHMANYFTDTGGDVLYAADSNSNSIFALDLESMSTSSIPLKAGAQPHSIAIAPFGYAFVADYGTNDIAVINVSSGSPGVTQYIPSRGECTLDMPYGIAISQDLNDLYVSNYGSNTLSIYNPMQGVCWQQITVSNSPVSNPEDLQMSPDGQLLYVVNYGTNSITAVDTSSKTVTGSLSANRPVSFAVLQNIFYNGSTPGNIVFSMSSVANQISATLTMNGNVIANVVTSNSVSLGSASASESGLDQFVMQSPGNANYTPGFLQKEFGIMRAFPAISMQLTYNSGAGNTIVTLSNDSQSNTISITASSFPITLTANVATVANQLDANVFLSNSSIGSFNGIFSRTWNSIEDLGYGTQSLVFNSIGGSNYLPVDPEIVLSGPSAPTTTTTIQPSWTGGGGGQAVTVIQPTVMEANGTCTILNMSKGVSKTCSVNGLQFTVGQNIITLNESGTSVNGNGYLMQEGDTKQIGNESGSLYYLKVLAIDYYNYKVGSPTVNLEIYAQSQPTSTSTESTTTTIPQGNTTGTVNVQLNLTNNSSMTVYLPSEGATLKFTGISNRSAGPASISKLNVSSLPSLNGTSAISAINVSVHNVTIDVTMLYNCSFNGNIVPYVLLNGTWVPIQNFTVNSTACTIAFSFTEDPIFGIFSAQQPANTTTQATSTAATTTTKVSTQGGNPSPYWPFAVAIVVIIVIGIIAYYLLYVRK